MDRRLKTSVNNFIHCGDEYLFLLRHKDKKVDANRLNSIGGHVEPGENYLDAVIRETEEETGYVVASNDLHLAAIVRLEGGYKDDWLMAFFVSEVTDKNVPLGMKTPDGDLMWIHKDELLNSKHELVDDLNILFHDIANNPNEIIFSTIQINEQEKVASHSTKKLSLKK